jgi:hypothetical protein
VTGVLLLSKIQKYKVRGFDIANKAKLHNLNCPYTHLIVCQQEAGSINAKFATPSGLQESATKMRSKLCCISSGRNRLKEGYGADDGGGKK